MRKIPRAWGYGPGRNIRLCVARHKAGMYQLCIQYAQVGSEQMGGQPFGRNQRFRIVHVCPPVKLCNPIHLLRPARTGKQGFSRPTALAYSDEHGRHADTDLRPEGGKTGALRPDPAQRAALPLFQPILDHLGRPAHQNRRSAWPVWSCASPRPAPGLYLWGGVGRGKSMLMDLFVAHAGDVPKRRVGHFSHAFMQEIHAGDAQGPRQANTQRRACAGGRCGGRAGAPAGV